jgi:hypothetical protein
MNLPFTAEQFLLIFERYNLSVWPAQIILAVLGLLAIVLAARPIPFSGRIISLILGFLWIWMGLVYHIRFFSSINPAAYAFGALFALQGITFLIAGTVRRGLSFRTRNGLHGVTGALLLGYAMIVYPVLGTILGHAYPGAPTFGLPCPTTIFTFGLLLWTDRKFPRSILAIPAFWSLVGFSAALSLGILEDIGLLVAGVAATALIIARDRSGRMPAITAHQ